MNRMFSKFVGSVALTLGLAVAGCGAPDGSTPAETQAPAARKTELRIATPDAQKLPEEARAALEKAIPGPSGDDEPRVPHQPAPGGHVGAGHAVPRWT